MKRLLCFFTGMLLLIGSASAQAQTTPCIGADPSTISAVADGQLHHYVLSFQNAGLIDTARYAIEYQFYYNDEPIPEDSLDRHIRKDTSYIATKYMPNAYTGSYIASAHDRFPGRDLEVLINLASQDLNYFYGQYLKNELENIRFSIMWRRSGNYKIEVKVIRMSDGTRNNQLIFRNNIYIGGHNASATSNVIASTELVTTKHLNDTTIYVCYNEITSNAATSFTRGDMVWTSNDTWVVYNETDGTGYCEKDVQFITNNACNINRLDSVQTIRVGRRPEVNAFVNASGNNTTICSQTTAGYAILTIDKGKAPFSVQPMKGGQSYGEPITVEQLSTNIRVGGLSAGTYTFVVTDANECSVTTGEIIIAHANSDNEITITPTPSHVTCHGGDNGGISTSLEVTGVEATPYTYAWSKGNTPLENSSANITGLTAGTYTVVVTDNMGCTGTATVTVTEAPAITTTKEVSCCASALPYRYDPQHADTVFTEAGTKLVKYQAANGCDSIVSVTLTVYNNPEPTITGNDAVCANGEITLSTEANMTGYTWTYTGTPLVSDNATSNTITLKWETTGEKSVTVSYTDAHGCSAVSTDSKTIMVNALPTTDLTILAGEAQATSPLTVCAGTNVSITAAEDYTYAWKKGDETTNNTSRTLTLNNITSEMAGSYTVVLTNSETGCTATSSAVTINVNAPAVVLSNIQATRTTICREPNGNGTTLSVEPASSTGTVSYAWSNNRTQDTWNTASITVNPSDTTVYTVVATATVNTNNVTCTATDTKTFTVNVNAPAVTLNDMTDVTICQGGSTTLEVSDASHTGILTYAWSEGSTAIANSNSTSIEVTPNATTTYTVVATATVGTGNDACPATDEKEVTVTVNAPAVTLNNMTDVTICQGGQGTTLTIENASHTGTLSYAWSAGNTAIDNSTSASISVNPEATTIYTVVVTATVNTNGVTCTATASKSVTVNVNAPAVTISDITGTSTICAGSSTTLSVVPTSNTGTVSYAWTAGGEPVGSNSNTISVSPNTTTEYTVVATATVGNNNVNCTATATKSFEVTVNAPAVVLGEIAATNGTTICKGGETTLSVEPTSYTGTVTYAWSNQETGSSITVSPTSNTTYIVTATATVNTNSVTCTKTDIKSVQVTVNAPAITMNAISGDTHFCLGGSTQLTASTQTANGDVTYAWSPATDLNATTGATVTATPTAEANGTITYTVVGTATVNTNNVTCTATDSRQVILTINDTVKLTATGDLTQRVCQNSEIATVTFNYENATITHTTIPAGLNYSDENGTVTISGTPTAAGEFEITITATSDESNPSCGSKTKKFNLTVDPEVTLSATNLTQNVCAGSSISDVEITNANSTVTTTTLPTGLTFANNKITGTPTVANNANNPHYTVTITATSNQTEPVVCQAKTQTFTLTVNPTVVLEADNLTQTVCAGSAITAVELEIENANTPTFTYTKDGGNNVTGLPTGLTFNNNTITGAPTTAGTYVITITATSDQNNPACASATLTFNLTVNPTVTLTASNNLTQSVCAGSNITDVEITYANANTPTFTYTIDNNNEEENGLPEGLAFSNNKITGAPTTAGEYVITITATSNQTEPTCAPATLTFNLTVNPTVVLEADNLTQTVCAGSAITAVELEIENANTPTFTYTKDGGNNVTGLPTGLTFNNNTITGAPTTAGTYVITITATSDQNNPACASATLTFNLTVNPTVTLTASNNLTQSVCAGSNIADVTITTANANTPTFTYTKDGGNSNTGLPTGLTFSNNKITGTAPTTAGTYEITITATSNQEPACTSENATFNLTVKALPELALSNAVICASASDINNTLTMTTDDGMSNYSWNVNGGTITEGTGTNSIKVNWATAGTKNVSVTYTDPNTQCSGTTAATVTVYAAPDFTLSGNPTSHSICAVEGTDEITISSNNQYSYDWSHATDLDMEDIAGNNNAKEFKSNTAGSYTVTVIGSETHDNLNCQTTQNVTVTVNAQPTVEVSLQTPTCHGETDGSISTTVTGGATPYQFEWSNQSHSNNLSNVGAGTYSVTVTDANGCHAYKEGIELTQPEALTASRSNHVDADCHGASTGSFTVAADNGVGTPFNGGKYLYKLNDDQNGELTVSKTYTNLPAGNYVVTISDQNGCSVVVKDTIHEPAELAVTAISGADNYCLNAEAASLSVTATGGNLAGTYHYSWNVSSNNGESWTEVGTDANANTYTPSTTTAGTFLYKVTVSDACQNELTTENVTVTIYSLPTISDIAEQTICVGTSTTLAPEISGGKADLSYAWYKDNVAIDGATDDSYETPTTDAVSGQSVNYKLIVTDACQNTANNTFTVKVVPALSVADIENATRTICVGTSTTLTAVASNGTTPYTYQWYKNGTIINSATNASYETPTTDAVSGQSVTYKVVVTDACANTVAVEKTATVSVVNALTVADIENATRTICVGTSTTLTAVASNGTEPYTYQWYKNGNEIENATGASYQTPTTDAVSGQSVTYSVEVKDACANTVAVTKTATVSVNNELAVADIANQTVCKDAEVTLTASATGGNGQYTYAWKQLANNEWSAAPGTNNAASYTPSTATAGSEATYKVVVTDNCNNEVETSATVTVYDALAVENIANQTVCKDAEVTLTANATGGNGTYTYAWKQLANNEWSAAPGTNNAASYTPSTATAGSEVTYKVVVTDNCNNEVEKSATVTVYDALAVENIANQTVCKDAEVTLTANATGGNGTYTYAWYNGNNLIDGATTYQYTPSTATAGSEVTYKVVVTDNCNNEVEKSATVTVYDALAVENIADQTVCKDATVTLTATATGGNGQYTYAWYNGNNLIDGATTYQYTPSTANAGTQVTYKVVVTDNCENSVEKSATVTVWPALAVENIADQTVCKDAEVTLTANATGGNGQYTYAWKQLANNEWSAAPGTNNAASYTPSTATAGSEVTYKVVVTDNCNNEVEKSATVTVYDALAVEDIANQTVCKDATVTLTANATGGNGQYTYAWYNGNNLIDGATTYQYTPSTATAGSSVTYKVVVTDNCDNSVEKSATVTVYDALAVENIANQTVCKDATVTLTATATGGNGTYTYVWYNGNTLIDNATTYQYTPSTANAGTQVTYKVVVTDNCENSVEKSATVTVYSLPTVNAGEDKTICVGTQTALTASASADDGHSPFTFQWFKGNTALTGNTANDITYTTPAADATAGASTTYKVVITDACGNTANDEVMVSVNAALTLTKTDSANITCHSASTGWVKVTAANGTSPYQYKIDNDDFGAPTTETTATFNGLATGSHTVTVKDDCGTTQSVTFTLTEPAELALAVTAHEDLTCFESQNGSITVTASNGTPNYQYKIDNDNFGTATSEATATFENLAAGSHTVTVKDNCGVEKTASFTLTQPDALIITESADGHQNVSCYNGTNGSVTVNVSGGTTPYQYKVGLNGTYGAATAETSFTYANRPAEKDTIYVKDANGCENHVAVEITQPEELTLTENTALHKDVTCHGASNGEITVVAHGGFGSYLYNWNNTGNSGNSNKRNLAGGQYTIEVTDEHQCTASLTVTIEEPDALTLTKDSTNNACYGETNGTITITAAGGTTPYNYRWNDAGNSDNHTATETRSDLSSGTYTVTVNDANYCEATTSVNITDPGQFTVAITCSDANNEICADETVTFTAETTGSIASLQWKKNGNNIDGETGTTLSGIHTSGSYTVVATQTTSGCTVTSNAITLTVDTLPNVTITGRTSVCFESRIELTANNADNYVWSEGTPSVTGAVLSGYYMNNVTGSKTFTVTGTNSFGCTASQSHTVTVNDLPGTDVTITVNNTVLPDGADEATLCAGGNVTISLPNEEGCIYTWYQNGETAAVELTNVTGNTLSLTNVTESGTYFAEVTNEETGCEGQTEPIYVTVNALPTVTLSEDHGLSTICADSAFHFTATCATANSYVWKHNDVTIDGATTATLRTTEAGDYTVVVTDNNGCSNTSSAMTVTVNALPTVTLSEQNDLHTICADNEFHLIATSQTAESYAWFNGNAVVDGHDAELATSAAGSYTVVATDGNGCSSQPSEAWTATVNTLPVVTLSEDYNLHEICADSVFHFTVACTTATASATYVWKNGDNVLEEVSGTTLRTANGGSYTVVVTDGNGCSKKSEAWEATVHELPTVTLSNAEVCQGGSVALTAGGAYTYTWSSSLNGALSASTGTSVNFNTSNNTTPSTYTVTVTGTNTHSCSATTTATVTVLDLPSTGLTLERKEICHNASTSWTIENGNYTSYEWASSSANALSANGASATFTGSTTGTHTVTVTVTDGNHCTNSTSAEVVVYALPTPTLSSNDAVCQGNTITFTTDPATADNAITNYVWDYPANATVTGETNGNTLTLSWSDNGTKNVTVNYTDGHGCTATQATSRSITVNALPDVVITNGQSTAICLGNTVNLTATGATNYVWANNAGNEATITVEPKRDSTFTVTGTDANGCSNTASFNITVYDTVKLTATHTTQALCLGTAIEPIELTIANCTLDFGQMPTNELTYDETNNTITGELTTAGVHSFTITASSEHGCSSKSLPVFITMNDTVKLTATHTTQPLCLGTAIQPIVLDTAHCTLDFGQMSSELTYNATNNTITGELTSAGVHSFTITASSTTCPSTEKSVEVSITMNDTARLVATNTTQILCLGTNITPIVLDTAHCTLDFGNMSDGLSYNGTAHQIEGRLTTAGTHEFTITATAANNCGSKTQNVSITMNDTVRLYATNATQTLCLGTAIQPIVLDTAHCTLDLTALPTGLSYNTTDHQIEGEIHTADVHNFAVTASNGCGEKQLNFSITMNDTAHFEADNTTQTLCLGASITPIVLDTAHCTLNFGNMSNELSYNAAAHQIEGRLTTAGTHEFTITATAANNCGSKTQNVSITMNDTVKLVAISNADDFSQKFCKGTAMTTLGVNAANCTMALTGAPEGVTLEAVTATSATQPNYTMSGTPTETGTFNFTITASSQTCATSGKTITGRIVVDTIPAVAITTDADHNTICAGGSITMTATAGYTSYSWSNQATGSSIEIVPSADATEYTVTVTNGEGCSNTAETEITINALPTVTLSALDNLTTICADSAVHFTAACQTAETYAWKYNNAAIDGANTSTLRATEAGKYVVNVTDGNGCSNVSDTLTVTVNALPEVGTNIVNVSCTDPGAVTFIVTNSNNGNYTCAWNGGNPAAMIANADGVSITIGNLQGGDYTYTITDANTCAASGTVTVGDPGSISAVQTVTAESCEGATNELSFTIEGGTPEYTIEWVNVNNGEVVADTIVNTQTATIDMDILRRGDYRLTMVIEDQYGCRGNSDTVSLTVWPSYNTVREINIAKGVETYEYNGETYNVDNVPSTENHTTAHGCDSIISYVVNQYDLEIRIADTCTMTRSSYTRAYANNAHLIGDTIYMKAGDTTIFYAFISDTQEDTWNDKRMDMSYELLYNEESIADEEMPNLVSNFSIASYYDRLGVYYGISNLEESTGEIPANTLAFRQTANSTILHFDFFYFDAFKNIPNKVTFIGLENGTYTLKLKAELRLYNDDPQDDDKYGINRNGIYNPYVVGRKFGHLWGGYNDMPIDREVIAAHNVTLIVNETGEAPGGSTEAPANINEYSEEASVSTFPNPVNDQLNLRISGMSGKTVITITDAQGKVVRTINAELTGSEETMTYSVADFAQGMYFLNVRNNDTVVSQKFVVTRR